MPQSSPDEADVRPHVATISGWKIVGLVGFEVGYYFGGSAVCGDVCAEGGAESGVVVEDLRVMRAAWKHVSKALREIFHGALMQEEFPDNFAVQDKVW